jgi:hypothetical protein
MARTSTLKSHTPADDEREFSQAIFEDEFVNTVRAAAVLLEPHITRVFVSGLDTEEPRVELLGRIWTAELSRAGAKLSVELLRRFGKGFAGYAEGDSSLFGDAKLVWGTSRGDGSHSR